MMWVAFLLRADERLATMRRDLVSNKSSVTAIGELPG